MAVYEERTDIHMRLFRYGLLFLALLSMGSMLTGCYTYSSPQEGTTMTIHPQEDTQVILHNPDMGWVLYDNYLISPQESAASPHCSVYGYDFPGVDNVMLKFTWADIEIKKDVYDFSKFDYIYDYWTERGKTVTLGMSTESLLWYGLSAIGVPHYVTDAMPAEEVQARQYTQGMTYTYRVCDASNAYYMERMKLFLKAMADHMTETNRIITYIDLRGYGLWGEWHQGYQYKSLEKKRAALDGVMQAWTEAFPNAWLALSYSYDPDEPRPYYTMEQYYNEYLHWSAFDLAKKYTNLTLRRDGCGGAIQSNERIYCEEMFAPLDRGPFTAEAAGGYDSHESARNILDDGLTLHPNYFTIIGWANHSAQAFIQNEPELLREGLNRMGYRFTASELSYTQAVFVGGELTVSGVWHNRAVGRAIRNYTLRMILTDQDGGTHPLTLGGSGCDRWSQGEEYSVTHTITLPEDLKAGIYSASLQLWDTANGSAIGMAMVGCEADSTLYPLGNLVVLEG